MRDTVSGLLSMAGITSAPEQKLPDGQERPADLLVSSWRARTVAIDFMIITRLRGNHFHLFNDAHGPDSRAKAAKKKKPHRVQGGRSFQPFVSDT